MPHHEDMATCKRALQSPFTVDSNAVMLGLEPFDDSDPYRHQLSLERMCMALPYDLRSDQSKAEVGPCDDCTYGFLEPSGLKSLVCAPSPYKDAPGNAKACTTCLFAPQQPTQTVDCSVCISSAVNSADICQCVM